MGGQISSSMGTAAEQNVFLRGHPARGHWPEFLTSTPARNVSCVSMLNEPCRKRVPRNSCAETTNNQSLAVRIEHFAIEQAEPLSIFQSLEEKSCPHLLNNGCKEIRFLM